METVAAAQRANGLLKQPNDLCKNASVVLAGPGISCGER